MILIGLFVIAGLLHTYIESDLREKLQEALISKAACQAELGILREIKQ